MAVNDIWEVVTVCSTPTQAGLNVRHFQVIAEAGAGVTPQELADTLESTFQALYKPLMSDQARWEGVRVKKIRPLPVSGTTTSGVTAAPGQVVDTLLPKQVTGLVSLIPLIGGRGKKGRMYIPFPAEVDSEAGGRPSLSYIARAFTLALAFSNVLGITGAAGTITLAPGIFVRSVGALNPITGRVVSPYWATQRRRSDFSSANIIVGP